MKNVMLALIVYLVSLSSFAEGLKDSVCQLQNLQFESLSPLHDYKMQGRRKILGQCSGTIIDKDKFLTSRLCAEKIARPPRAGRRAMYQSVIYCHNGGEKHWIWNDRVTLIDDQAIIAPNEDFHAPAVPLVESPALLRNFMNSVQNGTRVKCAVAGYGNRSAETPNTVRLKTVSTVGRRAAKILAKWNLSTTSETFNLGSAKDAEAGDLGGPIFCRAGKKYYFVGTIGAVIPHVNITQGTVLNPSILADVHQ